MVIVASSWFFYITLPTLMMYGQTQIKCPYSLQHQHSQCILSIQQHRPQDIFQTATKKKKKKLRYLYVIITVHTGYLQYSIFIKPTT
jgi:hypothetical protein